MSQITDAIGSVIQTYDYDAYGNIVLQSGSLSNLYKYKTKETENTGMIYFGARYYNPLIGRFITPDPMGMVDGTNLYRYCGNDPINEIDEYGFIGYDGNRAADFIETYRFGNLYNRVADIFVKQNTGRVAEYSVAGAESANAVANSFFRYPRSGVGTMVNSPTSWQSYLALKLGTSFRWLRTFGRFSVGLTIFEGFYDLSIIIQGLYEGIVWDTGC